MSIFGIKVELSNRTWHSIDSFISKKNNWVQVSFRNMAVTELQETWTNCLQPRPLSFVLTAGKEITCSSSFSLYSVDCT